jgi:hypothetical protein
MNSVINQKLNKIKDIDSKIIIVDINENKRIMGIINDLLEYSLDNIFSNTEPFLPNYLIPSLSLAQNVNFHCSMSDHEPSLFLEDCRLENEFYIHEIKPVRKIPAQIRNTISFLLYLYCNKSYVIEKTNINNLLKSERGDLYQRFLTARDSKLIYLSINKKNYIKNVSNLFQTFVVINKEDSVYIFQNKVDFLSYLEQYSDL